MTDSNNNFEFNELREKFTSLQERIEKKFSKNNCYRIASVDQTITGTELHDEMAVTKRNMRNYISAVDNYYQDGKNPKIIISLSTVIRSMETAIDERYSPSENIKTLQKLLYIETNKINYEHKAYKLFHLLEKNNMNKEKDSFTEITEAITEKLDKTPNDDKNFSNKCVIFKDILPKIEQLHNYVQHTVTSGKESSNIIMVVANFKNVVAAMSAKRDIPIFSKINMNNNSVVTLFNVNTRIPPQREK